MKSKDNNKKPAADIKISRRNFLKGVGVAALGAGLAASVPLTISELRPKRGNSIDDFYEISPDIRRFDLRNNVRSRASWDQEYAARVREAQALSAEVVAARTRLELAFMTATGVVMGAYGNPLQNWPQDHNGGILSWRPYRMRFFPPDDMPIWEGSPEEASKLVKRFAIDIGASDVGIGPVDPRFVYTHERNGMPIEFSDSAKIPEVVRRANGESAEVIPTNMKYAISVLSLMPYEMVMCSPDPVGASVSQLGYSRGNYSVAMIAEFIRALGYNAIPMGPESTAMRVPLAIAAGLGEGGRNGLLISHKLGPGVRIACVFTDLPLQLDHVVDFGVRKFCDTCGLCAEHCPVGAVSHEPMTWEGPNISAQSGIKRWYINAEKCHLFNSSQSSTCLNCIRSCSYFKPQGFWTHDPFGITVAPVFGGRLMSTLDEWMGYGKKLSQEDYWNKPV
ncbi:MAG: reductive dehalogenase [Treponema sp.]|nr:reductive dehalogenase [Treponema sp.]